MLDISGENNNYLDFAKNVGEMLDKHAPKKTKIF